MIGLVCKDILVLRKTLGYYLVFILVYGALVVAGVFSASIVSGFIVLLSMLLPMSSIAYDDQAHWAGFAVSTPAGRRGVVAGKYIFSLLCILGGTVVVAALTALLYLLDLGQVNLSELGLSLLGCVGAGLIINAIILPLLLKFGAEKSRIISMTIFVVVFGAAFLLATFAKERDLFSLVPTWLVQALPAVLAIVAVGGFALSYCIARGIYEKKEL